MRPLHRIFALGLPLTAAAALAGCTDSGEGVLSTTYVTETVHLEDTREAEAADDSADPVAADANPVQEAYADILAAPGQYSFSPHLGYVFTGEYLYALADMTGDGIPELLVEAVTEHNLNPVRVFSADSAGQVVTPDDVLIDGAAGVGGSRTALSVSPGGDRIYQESWHSLSFDVEVEAFILQGDSLTATGETWTYQMDSPTADLMRVLFHPIAERGPLETMTPTTGGPAAGGNAPGGPAATPEPVGTNTVSGVVRVLTAPELAELQGLENTPNGEDSSHRFAVLVLDSPTMFSARASGNLMIVENREARLVGLGAQTPSGSDGTGFGLDGQRLMLSPAPEDCSFPLGHLAAAGRAQVPESRPLTRKHGCTAPEDREQLASATVRESGMGGPSRGSSQAGKRGMASFLPCRVPPVQYTCP